MPVHAYGRTSRGGRPSVSVLGAFSLGKPHGSALKLARSLGNSGLIEKLRGRRGAEVVPILKYPNHSLVRRDFHGLNSIRPVHRLRTAGGAEDHRIAVRETIRGLQIVKDEIRRQGGLTELPH